MIGAGVITAVIPAVIGIIAIVVVVVEVVVDTGAIDGKVSSRRSALCAHPATASVSTAAARPNTRRIRSTVVPPTRRMGSVGRWVVRAHGGGDA